MIEKQIFSTNAMSDVCLRQLAISPDETKIAFSRETQCGNVHTTPEVHIFDIIKNKDENLGNINISGVSQFSWSPNSKSLYFIVYTGESSVLEKVDVQ
jgi:Tol biopolymer transport system component